MSLYYKKFHPWRMIINTADVNKTTIAYEFFSKRNEDLEEDSEVEWVNEDRMESDVDEEEDGGIAIADQQGEKDNIEIGDDEIQHEEVEQYELREIDHQHYVSQYKLEQERVILKKSLDIQTKKREKARREFFSEMIRPKFNKGEDQKDVHFTKSNIILIHVAEIHTTEAKNEHEVEDSENTYDYQDIINQDNNYKQDSVTLQEYDDEISPNDFEVEETTDDEKYLNKDICGKLLLDLIDKALDCEDIHNKDFMEEFEINAQDFCKELILELVGKAVTTAFP